MLGRGKASRTSYAISIVFDDQTQTEEQHLHHCKIIAAYSPKHVAAFGFAIPGSSDRDGARRKGQGVAGSYHWRLSCRRHTRHGDERRGHGPRRQYVYRTDWTARSEERDGTPEFRGI